MAYSIYLYLHTSDLRSILFASARCQYQYRNSENNNIYRRGNIRIISGWFYTLEVLKHWQIADIGEWIFSSFILDLFSRFEFVKFTYSLRIHSFLPPSLSLAFDEKLVLWEGDWILYITTRGVAWFKKLLLFCIPFCGIACRVVRKWESEGLGVTQLNFCCFDLRMLFRVLAFQGKVAVNKSLSSDTHLGTFTQVK